MVTSCADLRIAQQMDPRSMSVDLSREGDEYVPEANLPGIDSDSVTASCDLGVLRVVMPIEQPAVRKDPPEAACFLTLGTQPCACADPGALFDDP